MASNDGSSVGGVNPKGTPDALARLNRISKAFRRLSKAGSRVPPTREPADDPHMIGLVATSGGSSSTPGLATSGLRL